MWRNTGSNDLVLYYYRGFFCVLRYLFFTLFNPFIILNKISAKNNLNEDLSKNSNFLGYFYLKKKWNFFNKNFIFTILDYLLIRNFSKLFYVNNFKLVDLRVKFRLKQVKWNFYNDAFLFQNKKSFLFNLVNSYLSGFRYIWQAFRFWFLALILGLTAFYYLMYIRLLPFNKLVFEWLLIVMFLYWLMSGFVFFIKKYQYGKFTAAIQRFWKRSYILFWLIESGVFATFFYLTLNASEEPTYMYDQMKIYKTHLFSWRWFLIKLMPLVSLIILTYVTQLSLKWNVFSKQSLWLLAITLVLTYAVWLEFYQFFHIISFYGNLIWVYDYEEFLW
jgi:hypothetical protein